MKNSNLLTAILVFLLTSLLYFIYDKSKADDPSQNFTALEDQVKTGTLDSTQYQKLLNTSINTEIEQMYTTLNLSNSTKKLVKGLVLTAINPYYNVTTSYKSGQEINIRDARQLTINRSAASNDTRAVYLDMKTIFKVLDELYDDNNMQYVIDGEGQAIPHGAYIYFAEYNIDNIDIAEDFLTNEQVQAIRNEGKRIGTVVLYPGYEESGSMKLLGHDLNAATLYEREYAMNLGGLCPDNCPEGDDIMK